MDVFERDGGTTTADTVHKREEFRQIVADVQELPETQRTALLLREIDALSYDQIAEAMDTTVPSVKSLLVRARVALAEAAEARLLTCERGACWSSAGWPRDSRGPPRPSAATSRSASAAAPSAASCARHAALAAVYPLGPLVFLKKLWLAKPASAAPARRAGGGAAATGGARRGAGWPARAAAAARRDHGRRCRVGRRLDAGHEGRRRHGGGGDRHSRRGRGEARERAPRRARRRRSRSPRRPPAPAPAAPARARGRRDQAGKRHAAAEPTPAPEPAAAPQPPTPVEPAPRAGPAAAPPRPSRRTARRSTLPPREEEPAEPTTQPGEPTDAAPTQPAADGTSADSAARAGRRRPPASLRRHEPAGTAAPAAAPSAAPRDRLRRLPQGRHPRRARWLESRSSPRRASRPGSCTIDFGPEIGEKRSSAQIKQLHARGARGPPGGGRRELPAAPDRAVHVRGAGARACPTRRAG